MAIFHKYSYDYNSNYEYRHRLMLLYLPQNHIISILQLVDALRYCTLQKQYVTFTSFFFLKMIIAETLRARTGILND